MKSTNRYSLSGLPVLVAGMLALLAGSISGQTANQASGASSSTGNYLRMTPSVVIDSAGFGGPMAAATLFLPEGWSNQGGVEWNNQYSCTSGFALKWSSTSEDGLTGVAILPHQRWEWNNYGKPAATPGCSLASIASVETYLDLLLQEVLPDANKLGFRIREDLQQENAPLNVSKATLMGQEQTWVEVGEVSFSTIEKGVEVEGTIMAKVVFNHVVTNGAMGAIENASGTAESAYLAYAPAGRYQVALFEAIRKSFQLDTRWGKLIAQHNAVISKINTQGAIKRSQIMSKAMSDIAEIRNEAWHAQQASSDKRAQDFINVLRDVQPYQDTNAPGGQVELSNMYGNAWRLEDGSYLLTDDNSFNPQAELGVNGNRLQRVQ